MLFLISPPAQGRWDSSCCGMHNPESLVSHQQLSFHANQAILDLHSRGFQSSL